MKTFIMAMLAVAAVYSPSSTAGLRTDSSVEVVRKATVRFRDIEIAKAEGWSLELTGCMESAEGAMGYHYGNEKLIGDAGQLDPTLPEALMYEPQADGSLAFVGVEYLVPFADWKGDAAPEFLDRTMIANEEFGVWTLHLWLKDNPHGTFVGWNPRVSCAHATPETR